MKVEVIAICYNEGYMLPFFIEHYKKHFNATINIFDNESTDNSVAIAKQLGCNVNTLKTNSQLRDDHHAYIKNNLWKQSKADWVICVDCDEFLHVNFDISKYTIIRSKGYDMIGEPISRVGVANEMFNKTAMFKPNKIKEIMYGPGCHTCAPKGEIVYSDEIAILAHHKYISEQYVFERHAMLENRLSDINKHYGWGSHYMGVTPEKVFNKFCELRSKSKKVL